MATDGSNCEIKFVANFMESWYHSDILSPAREWFALRITSLGCVCFSGCDGGELEVELLCAVGGGGGCCALAGIHMSAVGPLEGGEGVLEGGGGGLRGDPVDGRELGGLFRVQVTVKPDHTLDEIEALVREPIDQGSTHFQPTSLQFTTVDVGNKATNIAPGVAKARFNTRFNDKWTSSTLLAHLTERGVFCQWLPLHQMDLDTLRLITRTFLDVFPHASRAVQVRVTL